MEYYQINQSAFYLNEAGVKTLTPFASFDDENNISRYFVKIIKGKRPHLTEPINSFTLLSISSGPYIDPNPSDFIQFLYAPIKWCLLLSERAYRAILEVYPFFSYYCYRSIVHNNGIEYIYYFVIFTKWDVEKLYDFSRSEYIIRNRDDFTKFDKYHKKIKSAKQFRLTEESVFANNQKNTLEFSKLKLKFNLGIFIDYKSMKWIVSCDVKNQLSNIGPKGVEYNNIDYKIEYK